MRKVKIVCTIGPASSSKNTIRQLIRAGMNVARLNFSYGTHEWHKKVFETLREEAEKHNHTVAILQDLRGLKIRVGSLKGGSVFLRKGTPVFISPRDIEGDEKTIPISYPYIIKDARPGDRILMDDGLLQIKVIEKSKGGIKAKVIEGGLLKENKGVNLPGIRISASTFTEKDKEDLAFGLSIGVDYIAMSFVRSKEDIEQVKGWLKRHNATVPVIAKIEKPQALENIDGILDASDGLMVARGDLGVEVSPEEVPLIQKALIQKANRAMKPVITATQMLESMTEHMRPTRAEATDVANAVLDGTDALMLSAETATGKYPIDALKMMDRIIRYTEAKGQGIQNPMFATTGKFSEAVADAACRASADIKAKALVAFTHSGFTALLASKFRPPVPVIAFTTMENTCKRMALYWGVIPYIMKPLSSTDEMIIEVEKALLKKGLARRGDSIVIIASSPLTLGGKTNFMKLHRIENT